jgi:hypothetical protein
MVHVRYGIHYTMPAPTVEVNGISCTCDFPITGYGELTYADRQLAEIEAGKLKGEHPRWNVQLVEFMADFQVPAEVIPFNWIR